MANQTIIASSVPRANFPEQVGISSLEIQRLMEDMEQEGIETHSMMLVRHGKVAFETWRAPYAPDIPHALYSVSKAITSLAVGLAVDEGLLSVETRVIDIFPEYRPAKEDKNLEVLQIHHLLNMTAGKNVSVFGNKAAGDWIGQYVRSKWFAAPGEGWKYINENIYMLCAALHRVTGMSVIDFLTPRLFEPLGITRRPFWETDENGIEAGGWGLYLTTEELAKIVLCCQQKGQYEGRQVLPADWLAQVCTNQPEYFAEKEDGYSYCFWPNKPSGTYRMDGMFSQFGLVFEEYDAVLVFTNSEMNEGKVLQCIWRHFPKGFLPENSETPEIDASTLAYPAIPMLPQKPRSATEKQIESKTIHFRRKKLLNLLRNPLSVLSLGAVYLSANKAGNIDDVRFRFLESGCEMSWSEGAESNTVFCGMDGTAHCTPIILGNIHYTALCAAAWQNENTLKISVRPMESVFERTMTFRFQKNKVTMRPASVPSYPSIMEALADGVPHFFPNKILAALVSRLLRKLPPLLEPVHKGKLRQMRNAIDDNQKSI